MTSGSDRVGEHRERLSGRLRTSYGVAMTSTPQQPCERVLIAGAVEDLPEVHRMLTELPETAYGQVFLEVAVEEQVRILPAPPGVTVTWLVRSDRPSLVSPLVFADHGEPLAQALVGWMGEWGLTGGEPCTSVWIGCSDSVWVDQARAALRAEFALAGHQVQVESGA